MSGLRNKKIHSLANQFSSKLGTTAKEVAIILAAGHGKRIKSQRSKMLHKIWGVPTVQRVYNACVKGIKKVNTIIVVGIKAETGSWKKGQHQLCIPGKTERNRTRCAGCFKQDKE